MSRSASAEKLPDNLPLVVYRSWWRTMLAYLVVWTPSLALSGWIVFALGWRPLGDSWLINLAVIALVVIYLIGLIVSIEVRWIFSRREKIHRLLVQQKYQEALAGLQEHQALIERHPFLDRWRTILFLDITKYSYKEMAWFNIAFVHMRSGDLAKRRAAYEQCLAINPQNEVAIDNLNLTAAFVGEPLRPSGSGLTFCYAVDLRQDKRLANIKIMISVFCVWLGWGLFPWPVSAQPWYVAFIAPVMVAILLGNLLVVAYRLAATRMVLFDLYRADRLTRIGRHQEAIEALELTRAFFDEHPWVDSLRWLLLLSPTTYSYREWVLISLADVYIDLGDVEQYVSYNQECLAQNPKNAFARTRLEACNVILSDLGKPLIQLP